MYFVQLRIAPQNPKTPLRLRVNSFFDEGPVLLVHLFGFSLSEPPVLFQYLVPSDILYVDLSWFSFLGLYPFLFDHGPFDIIKPRVVLYLYSSMFYSKSLL